MRVKKLDIFGFKSFATKESLHFGQGVTSIVGPNGCGKSNVVDALRWVMGEQNARHLRGGQMSDIIFCGAEKKAPLGFAEVSLTLINDEHDVPLEYSNFSEIQITRRLYKSGDSEYEINKQKVRLKDITDFFLGTGVGTKAYSIIEQGRVSEIVSQKPQDRRNLIEEAAGITKYKAKKIQAERRMEDTRANLSRIIDIKNEIEKRVKSLVKEKEKLTAAKEIRETIKRLDLHLAVHQFLMLKATESFHGKEKNELLELKEKLSQDLHIANHHFEKILRVYDEKSEQKILLDQLILQHQSSKELAIRDRDFAKETSANNQSLLKRIHAQVDDLSERSKALLIEEQRFSKDVAELSALEKVCQEEQLAIKTNGQGIIDERLKLLTLMRDLQTKLTDESAKAARLQAQINALADQEKQNILDIKNHENEKEAKRTEKEEVQFRIRAVEEEISLAKEKLSILEKNLKDTEEALHGEKEQTQALTSDVTRRQQELLVSTSRANSLQEIDNQLSWSESGVSTLFRQGERHHMLGTLASVIRAREGEEGLVENCLRHLLDAAIVQDRSSLLKLMEDIKQKKLNSSTFICLDGTYGAKNLTFHGLQNLTDLVDIKGDEFQSLKGLISFYWIATDLSQALSLWNEAMDKGIALLTRQGELFLPDGRASLLMPSSKNGVLSRKNELTRLSSLNEENKKELDALTARLNEKKTRLQELESSKNTLSNELRPLGLLVARLEENHKQRLAENIRLDKEIEAKELRLKELVTRNSGFADKVITLKEEWSNALEQHKKFEQELLSHKDKQAAVEKQYEDYQERLKLAEIKYASNQEKLKGGKNWLLQVEENNAHIKQQQANFKEQIEGIEQEELVLSEKERQADKKIALLEKELIESSKQQGAIAKEVSELLIKKNEAELSLQDQKHRVRETADILTAISIKVDSLKKDISLVIERIFERYQTPLIDHVIDFHLLPIHEAQAKKSIEDNKRALDRVGPLNENAAREYEEFEQRLNFLTGQITDLESALIQLESAIKKINKTTKARFLEAFHNINQQFSKVFPRLFNGGKAELVLTNEEDALISGVDIIAKPPGKNIGSIELMSGGEKALTAISLIMAIFLIKPSPFCLLDEVDAPLDEANVARFSQLIKEMSSLSQFIVITHNRKTMETADQLYGVTMEDAGMSKIVAVQVGQAYDALKKSPPEKQAKPRQLFLEDI